MSDAKNYKLFVPVHPDQSQIVPGSAIVGTLGPDAIGVDFEKGGASNVQTFEEKIHHAAGRRAQNYPTIARMSLPLSDLKEVGTVRYDEVLRRWVIDAIDDAEALEAWAPGTHVIGGSEKLRQEAAGLLYSKLNASGLMAVSIEHAAGIPLADAILKVAALPGRLRHA